MHFPKIKKSSRSSPETDLAHLKRLDIVETFLQVWLNSLWVLGLSQDLQEVVVGQEVESREDLPLGLQVHVQRFLDLLQFGVHLVQLLQLACRARQTSEQTSAIGMSHPLISDLLQSGVQLI